MFDNMAHSTSRGLRRHVALFGNTNAGKSTLFNLLTGQGSSIVSSQPGTTTDPVIKNMELLPFGPITLIDTAGLDDTTVLGEKRVKKTQQLARRADVGIFLQDVQEEANPKDAFHFFKGDKLYVFTKCDLADNRTIKILKEKYNNSDDIIFFNENNSDDLNFLKSIIIKKLTDIEESEQNNQHEMLIRDLLPSGSTVVMVVPIDSGAPKGRLILPQVQLLRNCLDNGIKAFVTRETELEDALKELNRIDLVVTDSQVFSFVEKLLSKSTANIPLTSFSMLLARQKGNFIHFVKSTSYIERLNDNDRILILEACTHNHSHEDIGRVKIPKLLEKYTGKKLNFDFFTGYDIPEFVGLEGHNYAFAIMCGSCMINKKEISSRLEILAENNIPVTNYGVILAYLNGILDRCIGIFNDI